MTNTQLRRESYQRGRGDADKEIRRLLRLLDAKSVQVLRLSEVIRQQRAVIAGLRKR